MTDAGTQSSVQIPMPEDLDFDIEVLRRRYAAERTKRPWHVIVNTYLYAAAQRLGWRDGSGPQCCPFGADWYFFNDCHNYHLSPYSYGVAYQGPAHCVERPPDEWTPPSEWAWGASGPWDAIGDSDLTACAPASSPEVALPLP